MGFEHPPGDAGALNGAIGKFDTISSDLKTQAANGKSAFAHALSTWHGKRSDDFRNASGGLQLQVSTAESTVHSAAAALHTYSGILSKAVKEIDHLKSLADARQRSVDHDTKGKSADDPSVMQMQQHAASYIAGLETQAEEQRKKVRTAAHAAATLVDAATSTGVPGASSLSPAEIARRVQQRDGVAGAQSAMNGGKLTAAEAWKTLAAPGSEVPPDAINPDGSINAEQLQKDLGAKEKQLAEENPARAANDMAQDLWTVGSAPTSGWALIQLSRSALAYKRALSALPENVWRVPDSQMDVGKYRYSKPDGILDEIERGQGWTEADSTAAGAAADESAATDSLLRNGVPKFLDPLSKVLGVAAAAGDVWTLADPKSAADDKWAAGGNLAGLALTTSTGAELAGDALVTTGLVAADASLGWVPVLGWGLVAGTAAYEAWKHRKAIGHFITNTVPNFFTKTVPNVAHDVGSWVHKHIHIF